MAEWLRRLTRSHMGSPWASSNVAGCDTFRSPVFNKPKRQKVRRGKNNKALRKMKATQQFKMELPTPILIRESDKQS